MTMLTTFTQTDTAALIAVSVFVLAFVYALIAVFVRNVENPTEIDKPWIAPLAIAVVISIICSFISIVAVDILCQNAYLVQIRAADYETVAFLSIMIAVTFTAVCDKILSARLGAVLYKVASRPAAAKPAPVAKSDADTEALAKALADILAKK